MKTFSNGVLLQLEYLSGGPQGTVLGPLLSLFYMNDITEDTCSELRLFVQTAFATVNSMDINHLGCWARSWLMILKSGKCNIMPITKERIKKVSAFYI